MMATATAVSLALARCKDLSKTRAIMQNHSPNRAGATPRRRPENWLGLAGIIGLFAIGCYTKDAPDTVEPMEEPPPTTTEPRDLPGDGLTSTPDTTTREVPPRYSQDVPRAVGDIQNQLGLTTPHPDAGVDAGAPSLDGGS
jgi:hypothetical protein